MAKAKENKQDNNLLTPTPAADQPQEGELQLSEKLYIHRVQGSNFKCLEVIDVRLDNKGSLVAISGPNGAGKTSFIDMIWYTLGGKEAAPSKPIKAGETEMMCRVYIGGKEVEVIATRRVKKDGDRITESLTLQAADGSQIKQPQTFLNGIVGMFAFDPLDFAYMKPADQVQTLLDVLGLTDELDKIEAKIKDLETERVVAGRERDKYAGSLQTMTKPAADTPDEAPNLSDLSVELTNAQAKHSTHDRLQMAFDTNKGRAEQLAQGIKDLEAKLQQARDQYQEYNQTIDKQQKELKASAKALPNLDAIRAKFEGAEKVREAVVNAANYRYAVDQRQQAADKWEKLDSEIKTLRKKPEALLAAAKVDVEGLTIVDRQIMLNGVPFEQAATSEKLIVGLKVGMLANPKLRNLFIRDGSLIDSKNLALINKEIKDAEFHVAYEAVDESGKLGIVFEQGRIIHEPEPVKK